jgi:hypothetical protein
MSSQGRDFQLNGYPRGFTDSAINSKGSSHPSKEAKPLCSVYIPYMMSVLQKFICTCMQAVGPKSSILSPKLYNLYINDTPQTHGVHLALFADNSCLYATERKEGYVLRKSSAG